MVILFIFHCLFFLSIIFFTWASDQSVSVSLCIFVAQKNLSDSQWEFLMELNRLTGLLVSIVLCCHFIFHENCHVLNNLFEFFFHLKLMLILFSANYFLLCIMFFVYGSITFFWILIFLVRCHVDCSDTDKHK